MAFKLAQSFQNRTLALFHGRLQQQQALLRRIRAELPQPLAMHLLHCVLVERTLLLYTDAAVWASQLRFLKQEILGAAGPTQNPPVDKLQIRLLADRLGESQPTASKAIIPSAEKIAMLNKQANEMGDTQLRQALQRLSTTLARLKDE